MRIVEFIATERDFVSLLRFIRFSQGAVPPVSFSNRVLVCRLKDRPVNWCETHLGLRWRFICICLFLVILFSQRENEATREQKKKKSPYISYLSLYGSFRSTTKTRCLLGGVHMLTSQSFKFSIQSESLTDPKVKNRNENELCRIAKRLDLHHSL